MCVLFYVYVLFIYMIYIDNMDISVLSICFVLCISVSCTGNFGLLDYFGFFVFRYGLLSVF